MNTQQMVSQDPVQELKSERVQGEIALAEEPFQISLKSERCRSRSRPAGPPRRCRPCTSCRSTRCER